MNPVFLTLAEVLAIHADQVARYGGDPGLRDEGLLRSALAQPEAAFADEWLHSTLPSMASAYLYHLVKNHPFVDGNKRVGLVCALHFLYLNGNTIDADPDELADAVLGVATSDLTKEQLAAWLEGKLRPR